VVMSQECLKFDRDGLDEGLVSVGARRVEDREVCAAFAQDCLRERESSLLTTYWSECTLSS